MLGTQERLLLLNEWHRWPAFTLSIPEQTLFSLSRAFADKHQLAGYPLECLEQNIFYAW